MIFTGKRFEPDDPVITRFVSNMNEDVKIIRGLVSFLSLFPSLPKFLISMFTQVEIAKEHKKEYNEMFMVSKNYTEVIKLSVFLEEYVN